MDVLPAKVKLPRRYSFRYMELRVIDTSAKFQLKIDGISCDTVSAVDMESVKPVDFGDPLLNQIDLVSRNPERMRCEIVWRMTSVTAECGWEDLRFR